ncbi:MAG: hypothetical protein UT30_C0003G0041 [Candidatus Uhrbacteria bacterium GW2011_GWF2_39_13]|uniref:Uncharacterized protein n=1 Tax=Candidatus Uhrbacteria bacterium GW2011_GWF2_39_13 TaxID=1618995 RepID=A0A0G0QTA9_9BACT|nr:MAG: hypothetical protein UT30_C0003G0041 [Candidatus Uhrbacteria bacterium GW2011_GWF2_39_13]HAU66243.1 hypothetical protein [Candidatus Uhrbacteria bacterium]
MNTHTLIARAQTAVAAASTLGSIEALRLANDAWDLADTAGRLMAARERKDVKTGEELTKLVARPIASRLTDAGILVCRAEEMIKACKKNDEARAQAQKIAELQGLLSHRDFRAPAAQKRIKAELRQLLAA